MFGKLFGKKAGAPSRPAAKSTAAAPKAAVPAVAKQKRVNLDKRFTIIAETGQGSMSKVYRALDNSNGRVVCLKIQDRAKTSAAIGRAAMIGRLTEGDIGLKINHPNVVKTYDFGLAPKGEHFIVMEFVDGLSLTYARQAKGLDLLAKVDLLAQAAEGIAAVHRAGFIHRDIGPKNLLVDRDNHLKIIDFGLAVPNTPAFQRPGNRTGTLPYMAPELIRREPTDHQLDVFSFGGTALEFLTGKLPFDAVEPMLLMRQIMNAQPLDIAQADPTLPPELCAIVRKALARRKSERWNSMDDVAAALREIAPLPEE